MKAVFSSTYDPQYQFFIPIAAYSWWKLGVESICFVPHEGIDVNEVKRLGLIIETTYQSTKFSYLRAPKNKEATYAQLSRVFAGTLPNIPEEEWLITSDVDMAVFSKELTDIDFRIHVWGKDLVPENQMAMCYVSMPKWKWRQVFNTDNFTYQQMLDQHLGHIECEHFRGNYWGYDQEQLFRHVSKYEYVSHPRAHPGTQFAANRCDRDDANWLSTIGPSLFDAHLWRPGYEENNFEKIITLFSKMYPEDDLTWMREYRNKFVELL